MCICVYIYIYIYIYTSLVSPTGCALPPREAIWPRAGLRDEPLVAGVGWRSGA